MKMEGFGEIQIRPPVTEKEKKDHAKWEKRQMERREGNYQSDVENAGKYLSKITSGGISYSEKIALNSEGDIDNSTFMDNAGRTLLEAARSVDLTREGLTKLIDGIQEKFPHLNFSLDEENDHLLLTVESKIKKNSFAQWVSQGVNQWSEPKRIVHISEDGLFAFVDGSMTGIPIDQLENVEN